MPEKEPTSIVRSKPDGSFVLVHPDGREEPYHAQVAEPARIDAVTDDDIAQRIAVDPDVAPEMTADWFDAAAVMLGDKVIRKGGRPKLAAPKRLVTLRLDPEVVERFRDTGPGWQSRMNATLREHLPQVKRSTALVAKTGKTVKPGKAAEKAKATERR
jgi:uncharacterized protein (DUF4415 family)